METDNIEKSFLEDIVSSLVKTKAVHKRTCKKVANLVEDIGKNTFAYEKLMQTLIQQIIEPEEAIILGGTWRVKYWCAH